MYPPEDIEQTFFSSYFIEKPNFNVESIEVRLNEISLERLHKKKKNCHLMNMTKIEQFNTKKEK